MGSAFFFPKPKFFLSGWDAPPLSEPYFSTVAFNPGDISGLCLVSRVLFLVPLPGDPQAGGSAACARLLFGTLYGPLAHSVMTIKIA